VVQEVVTMYLRAELLILQERVRTWLMFCLTMGQNLGGMLLKIRGFFGSCQYCYMTGSETLRMKFWQLILLLRQWVSFSFDLESQAAYMKVLIEEYIETRRLLRARLMAETYCAQRITLYRRQCTQTHGRMAIPL